MPTYINTIIYKIVCKDTENTDCYIGHTTNFISRIREHKYACNNEKSKSHNIRLYKTIRDNGGYENWDFIKVEDFPCENKNQALARENYWCFEINSTLNCIMPILNVENMIKYKKKMSDESKLKTIERNKQKKIERLQFLEENKDKIIQHNKEVKKNYNLNNREKLNAKMVEYNKKNKEALKERNRRAYLKRSIKKED